MANVWQELSKEITQVVADAGRSVVAVDGRSGHTSSGIVWRKDFVVTAAHSVRQEAGIRVTLGSDQSVGARLVGRSRGTDLALLKLDQEVQAPPADFANTTSLAVGNLTTAVARTRRGNIVASAGIISGLMGEWRIHRTRIDQFIRPDLMLYPGFSGGALVDAGGKVLGLNTSGLLRGSSITIPSSTVTRIAEEIVSGGNVAQPYLGLVMQPVSIPESLQKAASVKAKTGLLVMHVESQSPADTAGTLIGDILLEIGGQALDDLQDVYDILDSKSVGQDMPVTLIRGGTRIQSMIKIGARSIR